MQNQLFPTIYIYWEKYQSTVLSKLKALRDGIVTAGDGCHDSMGHSAKFGAYTIFCCTIPVIIHFALNKYNCVNAFLHCTKSHHYFGPNRTFYHRRELKMHLMAQVHESCQFPSFMKCPILIHTLQILANGCLFFNADLVSFFSLITWHIFKGQ